MNRNLLIECPTKKIFDKVMDYIKSKGEIVSKTELNYNKNGWNYVGYWKSNEKWVAASKSYRNSTFGDEIISYEDFIRIYQEPTYEIF